MSPPSNTRQSYWPQPILSHREKGDRMFSVSVELSRQSPQSHVSGEIKGRQTATCRRHRDIRALITACHTLAIALSSRDAFSRGRNLQTAYRSVNRAIVIGPAYRSHARDSAPPVSWQPNSRSWRLRATRLPAPRIRIRILALALVRPHVYLALGIIVYIRIGINVRLILNISDSLCTLSVINYMLIYRTSYCVISHSLSFSRLDPRRANSTPGKSESHVLNILNQNPKDGRNRNMTSEDVYL